MNTFQTNTRAKFDFVGLRWLWFLISGSVLVVGIVFIATRGLNLGLDYTGGGEVSFYVAEGKVLPALGTDERAQLTQDLRAAASEALGQDVQVRLYEGDQIGVQFQATTDEELSARTQSIVEAIDAGFADTLGQLRGGNPDAPDEYDTKFVGPKIGKELRGNGLKALLCGAALILAFVWWRFEIQFAVAAIVALLHDAFIVLGAFAMGHWEIDLAFIAALLTILGYSINDTVVIFDRIRENLGSRRRIVDYDGIVNDSLHQTLARSINTVATVLIVLVFLFFLGGDSIHTFALALLVGITSGMYSSIFNAAQIVVQWRHVQAARAGRAHAAKSLADGPAVTAAASVGAPNVRRRASNDGVGDGAKESDAFDTKERAQISKGAKPGVLGRRKSKKRY